MEVIADFKKIINQALGRENMFGFQTTLANQLYFLFCGWGNAYYTDRISQTSKYLWFILAYGNTLTIIFTVISYIIYGIRSRDILLLIYTGFVVIVVSLYGFFTPALAMFQYKQDIEETILMADKMLTTIISSDKSDPAMESDIMKWLRNVMIGLYAPLLPYTFTAILDIVFFYENEKIKDYTYYLLPLSGLEHYGSLEFYIIFNAFTVFVVIPFFLIFFIYSLFSLLWVAICCEEAKRIIGELNSLTSMEPDTNIEYYKSMEPRFKETLRRVIRDINNLTQ